MPSLTQFLQRFKKYLPQSIFTRFLLIIAIPTLLAQMFAVYMFYERHWSNVSERLEITLANEIALVVHSIGPLPINDTALALAQRYLHFTMRFIPQASIPKNPQVFIDDYDVFSNSLHNTLDYPYHLYNMDHQRLLATDVQFPEGVLHIVTSRKRLETPTTYIFIMWMTGTALLLLLISVIFMRNQIRPIIRLARAADKFGKGQNMKKLEPEGATEIRKATQAFLDMKTRIDRLVSQRTEMLAGVSHDLRTPLTRMKLQLALLPRSQEIKDLEQDIVAMENMVQGYLDFAKSGFDTANQTIQVLTAIETITHLYRNHQNCISLKIPAGATITINPDYFRRIASNLIDNALRYGNNVTITAETSNKILKLFIDDNGPGIPEAKREEVFRPFYRLEQSRNPETGGTGLGLAVVRDLVSRCGGEISLSESPDGGLRATVKLPL
jgi:two-component system, OmpR family, osmolarity sensor histidine kinase EnvZ